MVTKMRRRAGGNPVSREMITPNPDPTEKTTESLLREIAHTKEFGDVLVRFVREICEQKILTVQAVTEAKLERRGTVLTLDGWKICTAIEGSTLGAHQGCVG